MYGLIDWTRLAGARTAGQNITRLASRCQCPRTDRRLADVRQPDFLAWDSKKASLSSFGFCHQQTFDLPCRNDCDVPNLSVFIRRATPNRRTCPQIQMREREQMSRFANLAEKLKPVPNRKFSPPRLAMKVALPQQHLWRVHPDRTAARDARPLPPTSLQKCHSPCMSAPVSTAQAFRN